MKSKQKNILLIIGFFTALILSYKLAFSKTFLLKNEFNQLKKEEAILENIPKQLSVLKQKETYYDSILTRYQLTESSVQNNLLKTINSFSQENDLKVVDFSEPHIVSQKDLTIKTYQFSVEGDYNSIVHLVYQLEQETRFGEIINFHFQKRKNYRRGKYYLQAHVLLRSFSQADE
ncbi:MAG TPA: type 4a pilus biogenesis protein PilO [Salinimicrobium sp.]|nr:type 4a pilus biogenesis protein PilO [Salinimicrobium sp.]